MLPWSKERLASLIHDFGLAGTCLAAHSECKSREASALDGFEHHFSMSSDVKGETAEVLTSEWPFNLLSSHGAHQRLASL